MHFRFIFSSRLFIANISNVVSVVHLVGDYLGHQISYGVQGTHADHFLAKLDEIETLKSLKSSVADERSTARSRVKLR